MKNKLLVIVVLMLCCFVRLSAETTEESCYVNDNGNINIKWNKGRRIIGKIKIDTCTFSYKEEKTVYCEKSDCSDKPDRQNCSTCTPGSKGCAYSGGKICGPIEPTNFQCLSTNISKSNLDREVFVSTLQVKRAIALPHDEGGGGGNSSQSNNNTNIDPFLTGAGINVDVDQVIKALCSSKYKFSILGPEKNQECNPTTIYNDLYAAQYVLDSGDTAYCLQPSALGPDQQQEYILDNTFDVSVCKNSLELKNGGLDFRCGLAHILYMTVDFDSESGTYMPKKEGGKDKFDYGSITYALRLWAAKYAPSKNNLIGDNVENYTKEFSDTDWYPSGGEENDYYRKTANLIEEKKDKDKYPYDSDDKGIIVCGDMKDCPFKKSVELYLSAYEAINDSTKFLDGLDFSKEVPVITSYPSAPGEITTDVKIPKEIIKDIKVDCTDEEYAMGICDVDVEYYDENGKQITDLDVEGFCEKEYCTFKAKKLCKEITYDTSGLTANIIIKGWRRNNGYVRFYTHATNPAKYQKMITFAFNLEECETKDSEPISEPLPKLECPCDDNDKCTDLETKTNLPNSCSNDDYQTGTSKDPNMNCILNSCYSFMKNKYDYTFKVNANPNICRVYCRDEIELYVPGKTSVYAGMQFSYNLGQTLKNKGIFTSTIADKQSTIPKLTSIVIHKKQCTSEINYEYWKTEYDKKMNEVEKYYKEGNTANYNLAKKQASQWIYDLQNCNLYSHKDIIDPYKLSSSATTAGSSKDSAIKDETCTGEKCLKLDVTYDDKTYGSKKTLGKIEESNNNVKTYYCKNSSSTKCYEYKKDKPVEINAGNYNSNSTTNLTYKDCSGSSCQNKNIKLPNNDYATFIVSTETDFYQNRKYKTSVYSGAVTEVADGEKIESNQTLVANYSYPVSNGAATGTYNIKFNFSNIPTLSNQNYEYSCKYDVYNTTLLYDCAVKNNDGTLDLSKCNNECYEIVDGVPNIKSECMNWESSDNKQYGFIFRSVNLNELFPNASISVSDGISTRSIPINWSDKTNVIKQIQETSETIFTDDKYLEYSYTLTPETIKKIKQYNKEQNSKGGYANNTLTKCEFDSESNIFKNCKSNFLIEIKSYPGIVVKGNKAGGN